MKNRLEVCFSGKGGQGSILAGIILAEAAGIYDGKNVSQTQSYGPEARGGASKSEVIISSEKIYYPEVIDLDILVCLSKKAYEDYSKDIKEDKIIIGDSQYVKIDEKFKNRYLLPFKELAKEKCGKEVVTNILCLGAFTAITKIVSFDAIKKAVLSRVPKGTEKLNEKALNIGYEEGMKLVK